MPSHEEITDQLELLATHRRTLAVYLKQYAQLGGSHIPPGVAHGIIETRNHIKRVKNILTSWGIPVEYHPDDEPLNSVEHEYPQVESNQTRGMVVSLRFKEDGSIVSSYQELRASLMEAVFATESQMPVTFDVFIDELDSGKQLVSRKETEESTPENRIAKINLLKQIRRLEERQTLLKEALYLLLLPSIRGVFLNTDELIESIRGLGFRLFDSGLGYFSINSCSLDVFREDPKINTIIHIEQSEATRMEQRLKLKSVFALTGPGWDLLDLPKETRIRKAIPAIVLEVARVKIHSNQPLDLLKVLILDAWSIGLH